jgi:hypothetical protein
LRRAWRHDDEFGHAVAEEHVVGGHAFDADAVVVGGHRLAGRRDAARVAVALGVRDAGRDLLHDRVRCDHAERRGVPEVQLEDLMALGLELASSAQYRPPDVIPDVGQPARLRNHVRPPSYRMVGDARMLPADRRSA